MAIKLISAKNPRWGDADKTVVNLTVKFEHIQDEIDFSATLRDPEEHGRMIFERAKRGEFGEIAPHIPFGAPERAAIDSPKIRTAKMELAVAKVQHYTMMGQPTMVKVWQHYYQQLYGLINHPKWPAVIWPTEPVDLGKN